MDKNTETALKELKAAIDSLNIWTKDLESGVSFKDSEQRLKIAAVNISTRAANLAETAKKFI